MFVYNFMHINKTLSNDTKVNNLVNLTVTFILKIANFGLLPPYLFSHRYEGSVLFDTVRSLFVDRN